jgi:hypothetical protein
MKNSGDIGLRADAWKKVYEADKIDPKSITYIIFGNGKWNVQRGAGPRLEVSLFPSGFPTCTN